MADGTLKAASGRGYRRFACLLLTLSVFLSALSCLSFSAFLAALSMSFWSFLSALLARLSLVLSIARAFFCASCRRRCCSRRCFRDGLGASAVDSSPSARVSATARRYRRRGSALSDAAPCARGDGSGVASVISAGGDADRGIATPDVSSGGDHQPRGLQLRAGVKRAKRASRPVRRAGPGGQRCVESAREACPRPRRRDRDKPPPGLQHAAALADDPPAGGGVDDMQQVCSRHDGERTIGKRQLARIARHERPPVRKRPSLPEHPRGRVDAGHFARAVAATRELAKQAAGSGADVEQDVVRMRLDEIDSSGKCSPLKRQLPVIHSGYMAPVHGASALLRRLQPADRAGDPGATTGSDTV